MGLFRDSPFSKGGARMDGMAVLIVITLLNVNLCCVVYLTRTAWKTVFRIMEIKELLDNAKQS